MLKRTDGKVGILLIFSSVLAFLLNVTGVTKLEWGWMLTALIAGILVSVTAYFNSRTAKK
ncbi:hypothetical protein [Listeria valentina]|uniref:hypothetical protein n=1 Tax=Listeria valentina TaxID=2705293 RepID=UPI0014318DD6|nr:hypothetical protein [Listeria valentina]